MSFDIPLFFRLLFAKRPDVVFVEPPPTTGAMVRLVCAIRRIPYVYDVADIWSDAAVHATNSSVVIKVLRAIERFALRGARSLVTISEGVADRLKAISVDTPTVVTGFGADTESFIFQAESSPEPLFLYAGTFTELHGASVLVEAFAEFQKSHPEYRLAFFGNGTGQAEMLALASCHGIEESVSFHEPVSAQALNKHLNRATASLATLLPGGGYEYAFTTKVYSSLAAGCPVIFAGPGPTQKFLRDATRQVKAGSVTEHDPVQISLAMRALADRPLGLNERKELARWTAKYHSMASVANRVARVIENASTERLYDR